MTTNASTPDGTPAHPHDPKPAEDPAKRTPPVTPGGPLATPDTPEGRTAAQEEGEEA